MTISIDADRLQETFEKYSAIGATDNGGLHRLTLSDADVEAREEFVSDIEALGLDVEVDEVGNIYGYLEGATDEDAVMIGSHLDSQPMGGRYDGQLGVLTALETLRAFDDADIVTDRPLIIVNWTNEEGARYKPAMLGSGVYAGEIDLDRALGAEDDDGITLGAELERTGYDGSNAPDPGDVHSFLELHVEQGPQLIGTDDTIGIVEGVLGMAWIEVTVEGKSDHAGPSPVHDRNDPMMAAAAAMDRIGTMPNRLSADARTTIGRVSSEPDSVNVIPSKVTFTVDIRSFEDATIDRGLELIESELETACAHHGTTFDVDQLWRISNVEFSETVQSAISRAVEATGIPGRPLLSGAGHDACYVNSVIDTGMMFVPSVGGISHSEDEFTEWDDCLAGAEVYANTVHELASLDA
jgi:N-carbamoyl-L-amino-acid hydrolase